LQGLPRGPIVKYQSTQLFSIQNARRLEYALAKCLGNGGQRSTALSGQRAGNGVGIYDASASVSQ
jgi:hypothetical protein